MIESGINHFYSETRPLLLKLVGILEQKTELTSWNDLTMMQKVYEIFIKDIPQISDNEIRRLEKETAQNYYENYITINQKKSLNENVSSQLEFFKKKAKGENPYLYVGKSYGEIKYPYDTNSKAFDLVYINLSRKTDQELANLAVVKLKMEDDFISFKLNKLIVMLYDFNLISRSEYHIYIYGTDDEKKIELSKYGLNIGLISRLQNDDQLKNLYFDEFNNLKSTPLFNEYLESLNDFQEFEIRRFID